MCHAATKDFAGLMCARFFLGVGEAAIAPGFTLLTGMFYKREEQPMRYVPEPIHNIYSFHIPLTNHRQSAWFFGNCIAVLVGGLIAYGIGNINTTAIEHWKLLFLILGAATSCYSVVLFFFLPDAVDKAVFLTENERAIAVQRTITNKTGILDNGKFKWSQAVQALKDPQAWCLILNSLSSNLCNGGITTVSHSPPQATYHVFLCQSANSNHPRMQQFTSIITAGFGFTDLKALLMQMPQGAAQIIFLVLTSLAVTYIPHSRVLAQIFNTIVSVVGMLLIWKLNPEEQVGRMVGLSIGIVYAINLPISLSIVTSNVAGFSKKSVVSSLLFISYCVGNVIGPQFFLASEEPSYPVSSALFHLQISCGIVLGAVEIYANSILFLDWYQGCHVWSCVKYFLPGRSLLLLYL